MSFGLVRQFLAALASLFVFAFCASAFAAQPVIEAGREADVLRLFAPYGLGSEVAAGWRLSNVAIRQTEIEVGLGQASEQDASFILVHPTRTPSDAIRTPSFAVARDVPDQPDVRAVRDALIQAIRNNDDGKFWRVEREVAPATGLTQRLPRSFDLFKDGFVLSIAGALLIFALAIRVAWNAPRYVRIALPLIVLAGAALRLTLAPASFLGAWPWSRRWPNWYAIWTSPVFSEIASR